MMNKPSWPCEATKPGQLWAIQAPPPHLHVRGAAPACARGVWVAVRGVAGGAGGSPGRQHAVALGGPAQALACGQLERAECGGSFRRGADGGAQVIGVK